MTAATTKTESHPASLAPVQSRTWTRIAIGAAVAILAGIGIWGAISAVTSMRAYQQAERVTGALQEARYSLALERSAVRASSVRRAKRELGVGAELYRSALRKYSENATEREAFLAASLLLSNTELVRGGRQALAARTAGASATEARDRFEAGVAALDAELLQALRNSDQASQPVQGHELGAAGLLVVLGLASCTIFVMRLAGYRRRLERARKEELEALARAALTDSLTGLGNHRAFHEELHREITRRARSGSCFSLVMLDVDGLKEVNDTLGHRAGDERIRAVADCLAAVVGAAGGAYRIGGDEFMVMLPNERAWGALAFAQRVQGQVARHPKQIRVSCGVVESTALESADTLVHNADVALYEAKRTGRRIVVYSEGLSPKPTDRPEDILSRRQHRMLATALAQAVDAKDAGTRSHCETVSTLCTLIAEQLGLDPRRTDQLAIAGLLHDVGKIGIADALLRKDSGLDPEERNVMTSHVHMGYAIVAAAGLEQEAEWILHHHEHVDGTGYPDRIAGAEIPLESRIIRVADTFEAMTANRPYSPACTPAEAFAELDRGAGTQFDRECVEALRAALASDVAPPSRWYAPAPEESAEPVPTTKAQAASA